MPEYTAEEFARFNSKWQKVGDCMIWTDHKDKDGYGIMGFRRANRKAHRLALFFAGRQIPEGYIVNHACRNRACVNPQHLRAIPASENALRDSVSASYINSQKEYCSKGHPYDRVYGKRKKQRYCSICDSEKGKRLRAKWKAEGIFKF